MEISTKILCEILHKNPNCELSINECINLIEHVHERKFSFNGHKSIKQKLINLDKETQQAFNKCPLGNRKIVRALNFKPNGNGNFEIDELFFEPIEDVNISLQSDFGDCSLESPTTRGRPKKTVYSEMEARTQRRYTLDMALEINDTEASLKIAKKIAKLKEANHETKDLINSALHKLVENTSTGENKTLKISEEEALGLIIHQNLSVENYNAIRKITKNHGCDIFPSYYKVNMLKKTFEPKNIQVTDTKASLPLDDLFESTSKGIIESTKISLTDTLKHHELDQEEFLSATLVCMWGMDGTTGQSIYHQADSAGNAVDDHSLFVASMTPLKLVINDASNTEKILWKNPSSGSYVWNRCISMEHTKETDAYTTSTYRRILGEIKELTSHQIALNETTTLNVSYDFYLTMVDGKVVKVLSETTSYARCPCCKALPKDMNELENLYGDKFTTTNNFPHSISILHTIMNVVSLLYNIACRKGFCKWQVRGDAHKAKFAKNRSYYKERIFKAFGVKFDEPRQGGSGTSSTGSVCRRMLQDPKKLAEVLELEEDLVCRLAVILKVISCKEPINSEKFGKYCKEVYNMYILHY